MIVDGVGNVTGAVVTGEHDYQQEQATGLGHVWRWVLRSGTRVRECRRCCRRSTWPGASSVCDGTRYSAGTRSKALKREAKR